MRPRGSGGYGGRGAVGLVGLLVGTVGASFEPLLLGPEAAGLDGAVTARATGPDALAWNPAGLARGRGVNIATACTDHYGLAGFGTARLAATRRWGVHALGCSASASRFGDLFREQIFSLGWGMNLVERELGGHLSVGGGLHWLQLDAPSYGKSGDPSYQGGAGGWTADLGIQVAPLPMFSVGVVARHLRRPRLSLLADQNAVEATESDWRLGFAYRWGAEINISVDLALAGEPGTVVGLELTPHDSIDLRAGAGRNRITMGLGIGSEPWEVGVAVVGHRELGLSWSLGLDWKCRP